MKTILFPHQKAAFKKAKNVLELSKTMRFNMCTGAGKTVTTVHTIESLYSKLDATVVVAAHTTVLVEQFKNAVEQERKNNFPNSKLTWKFDTYQSLTKQDKLAKKIILVVDEVHQGGLENTTEKIKSYQKIQKIQKPFKIISLSATDSGVNEKLFGVKKSNTFFYTYNDAMRDNVINDCTITTIHTGLEQYFMDKNSKVEHKKTFDDLETAYEDCLENGVDFSDPETVKSYEEGKIASGIAVYFQEWAKVSKKHNVRDMEQAVFYVKTIELAERGVQLFTSYYNNYLNSLNVTGYPDAATKIVRAAHSHSEESDKDINDFKNKEFKVLFNVKQVQEGFDYPELSMIFDCAPSFSNNSRIFQQRLGRSLRKHSSKTKPSQYFIVTGLTTAVSPRYSVEKFRETVNLVEGVSGIDNDALNTFVQIGAKAKKDISTHFSDRDADESQVELGVSHASLFSVNPKDFGLADINKKINIQAVTGNLIVTGAYKETKVNQVTLSSILTQGVTDPQGSKLILIKECKEGKKRPNQKHPFFGRWRSYIWPQSQSYDPEFVAIINKINPEWLFNKQDVVLNTCYKLLKLAEKTKTKPSHQTKLGQALHRYTNPNSNTFRKNFTNKIKKIRPEWFVDKNKVQKEKIQKIDLYYKKHGCLPTDRNPDKKIAKLGIFIVNSIRKQNHPHLCKKFKQMGYGKGKERVSLTDRTLAINLFKKWVIKNKRLPSTSAKERRYYGIYYHYTKKASILDKDLVKWVENFKKKLKKVK